jgi:hypothetical protein
MNIVGRDYHVSRIIETRKSHGSLKGISHFVGRSGLVECENCSMGDNVRLFGLIFCGPWDSIGRYAFVFAVMILRLLYSCTKRAVGGEPRNCRLRRTCSYLTYRWICLMLHDTTSLSLIAPWLLHCIVMNGRGHRKRCRLVSTSVYLQYCSLMWLYSYSPLFRNSVFLYDCEGYCLLGYSNVCCSTMYIGLD